MQNTTTPKRKQLGIRVREDLADRLTELAKADGRSLNSYVERVLADHAKDAALKPS